MCLLRQRARSPHIALLQGRTRTVHIVADLSCRLLLYRVQRASRQPFQLVVGGTQQLFRILALAGGFCGSDVGRNLRRGFPRPPFANHNLPWRTIWRCCATLTAFSGSALRTRIRFPRPHALRRLLSRGRRLWIRGHRWRGFCRNLLCRSVFFRSRRSLSLSGGIRGASRVLLSGSHSRGREAQTKGNRELAKKAHSGVNRIVSHRCQERKVGASTPTTKKPGKRFRFPGQ
jgi:hypothetical protein